MSENERFPEVIRIVVLPQFEEDALGCLRNAGFEPEVGKSADGYPAFTLRSLDEREAFRAATAVPREYYLAQGYVGRLSGG